MNNDFKDILKVEGINHKGYGTIPKLVMQDRRLPIHSKAIYAYFCSFAGSGNSAFPSRDKICYDLNINKDTFTKYFRYLTAYGYIKIRQQNNENGKFAKNIYTMLSNPIEDPIAVNQLASKSKVKNLLKSDQENIKTNSPCPKVSDTVSSDPVLPDTVISDTKINSLKINNLKINKTTTPINNMKKNKIEFDEMLNKNFVVGDKNNSNIDNISKVFYKLTSKYPQSKDYNAIIELLDRPLDVPISNKSREKIIIDTLIRVHNDFKSKNPNNNINSFNYFVRPITDEFLKYKHLKGCAINECSSGKESTTDSSNIYTDEYGRKYDFTMLNANR